MQTELKNIKVLYVLDKSGFGGVQSIAHAMLAQNMPGVDITYFFLRNVNPQYGIADLVRHDVVYSGTTRKYSLSCFFELYRLVRSGGFQIVHLNGTKSTLFGYLIKRLCPQVKLISHDHSGEFDYQGWFVRFLKMVAGGFDMFLCVSERRRRFLMEACDIDAEKIHVLNNFVDEQRFSSAIKTAGPGGKEADSFLTLGFVGRLSHVKGCDVLIRALPHVRSRFASLRVLIAGEGPDREALQRLAEELGVAACVSFLGYVAEPAAVYAQADIFVIPSRAEEGPISLFEAWMMGVPVVASNAPVIDERIVDHETGLLFVSENHAMLAEKILELSTSETLRATLVFNGRRAVRDLTAQNYVARLGAVYSSLCEDPAPLGTS